MKKLIITGSGNMTFIDGSLAKGITIEFTGDETVEELDVSDIGNEEWEKIKKTRKKPKKFKYLFNKKELKRKKIR